MAEVVRGELQLVAVLRDLRVGGVITPALLIRMLIGRSSPIKVSPRVATEARDDRSSTLVVTFASGMSYNFV